MAQPSKEREILIEEHPDMGTQFDQLHRDVYLPIQHGMMILSLLGFASSLHCLYTRWPQFRQKEFSPAHVAFIFPLLSHTNAVQAYRAGVDSFSNLPVKSPFKIVLFAYWLACLLVGTILNLIFTYKYVQRIPQWTKLLDSAQTQDGKEYYHNNNDNNNNIENNNDGIKEEEEEEEVPSSPPSPSSSFVQDMLAANKGVYEGWNSTWTNTAVLQANETGSLIRLRRGTDDYARHGPFKRTRQISALGFDLAMTDEEFRQEQAELLHRVARMAPRIRHRTSSTIPMGTGQHDMSEAEPSGVANQAYILDRYGTFDSTDGDRLCNDVADDEVAGRDNHLGPGKEGQSRHYRSRTWGAWI